MELHEWVHKYINDEVTQEKLNKWDMLIAKNHAVALERLGIAKNLINLGLSIEDISKATNLTKEEIEKIKLAKCF